MAANPPQASIAELAWLFLSPVGRISRQPYWLALGVLFCLALVLGRIWENTLEFELAADGSVELVRMTDASLAVLLVMLPLEWSIVVVLAKRCRDRGWSGLVALLWLVPLFNVALAVYLGLVPGAHGPNAYGRHSDRPPT